MILFNYIHCEQSSSSGTLSCWYFTRLWPVQKAKWLRADKVNFMIIAITLTSKLAPSSRLFHCLLERLSILPNDPAHCPSTLSHTHSRWWGQPEQTLIILAPNLINSLLSSSAYLLSVCHWLLLFLHGHRRAQCHLKSRLNTLLSVPRSMASAK